MLRMSDVLLHLRHATVMRGSKKLLDDLNLTIAREQHTAILGANGSGKSTLVKLISHHIYPLYGAEVRVLGHDHWVVADLRKELGVVSASEQRDYERTPPLEVFDCVLSNFFSARGVWAHHDVTDVMRKAAHDALERMGVAHLEGRPMSELSTGEARRVLIARALVHRPKTLLLDEPCAGLDPAARADFLERLRGVVHEGVTLVMVTHHIEDILPEINHVLMLREGRVLHEGPKAKLLTRETLTELFQSPLDVVRSGAWYSAIMAR